ncbi:hypothetical protein GLYMA_15G247050v4 [Glycine max]|nr:hypothetical protein GLYMA_15G247050v4 [Glycine max]
MKLLLLQIKLLMLKELDGVWDNIVPICGQDVS